MQSGNAMRRSQEGKMKGSGSGSNNLRTSGEGSLGGASSKASKVTFSFVCVERPVCLVHSFSLLYTCDVRLLTHMCNFLCYH